MLPMLLLSLFTATAAERDAEEVEATLALEDDVLLEAADGLLQSGERDAAEGLLRYVAESLEHPSELRHEAELRLHNLERAHDSVAQSLRLVGTQGLAGAVLFGPVLLNTTDTYVDPGAMFALTTGGLALGTGGALWYANRYKPTRGQVTAIIASQQVATAHAMVAGSIVERGELPPESILIGALAGTAGGVALASRPLDGDVVAAANSGLYWGTGLSLVLMGGNGYLDGDATDLIPVLAAADLTAVGAGLLAGRFGVDRNEIRGANLGGIAGAGVLFGFAAASQEVILWTDSAVSFAVIGGAVLGGASGMTVTRKMQRPTLALHRSDSQGVTLGLPTASVGPNGDLHLNFANIQF